MKTEAWLQLKRMLGLSPAVPLATQEGQIRYVRQTDTDDGIFYGARTLASGTREWQPLDAGTHTHSGYILRHVHAQRDAVTDAGAPISSTTGEIIPGLTDTMILASGLTYDIVVWGNVQLSAGIGGSLSAALNLAGTGITWTPVYIGTPTENGERSVMPTARVTGVAGSGQTITVTMLAKRVTVDGLVGSASFQGFAIAREAGVVV